MRRPLFALLLVSIAGCSTVPGNTDGGDARLTDAAELATGDALANTDATPDAAPTPDAGCGLDGGPLALWQLPRSGPNQFALPFPSDLVLTAQGNVDFNYFPGQNNTFVAQYTADLREQIHGYSTQGAAYFRFEAPPADSSLPTAAASLTADSTIQLLDIDPASPDHGHRVPVQTFVNTHREFYWQQNTLAVAPVYGFPLRPSTRYAIVLTTAMRSSIGCTYRRDSDLEAVLATGSSGDAMTQSARTAMAPALAEIAAAGVSADRVLSFTVFTTQDPTGELFRAAASLRAHAAMPAIVDAMENANPPTGLHQYDGHYGPSPIFQRGISPYDMPDSGGFVSDTTGEPQIQDTINIAFTLTVPAGKAPAGGWPIAVYAHGSGGNARSFVDDGTALSLGTQGIAVIGFDQIFNGERTVGTTEGAAEVQFFNFQNVAAGRTNNRQAALDLVQIGRLVRQASLTVAGTNVPLNAQRVMFFGHSQGGLNGPLWLALEPYAGAAVLSGAGGTLGIALTQKTSPVNIPNALAALLMIPATEPITGLHPAITLLQTAVDVSDPSNYARFIIQEPAAGNVPHHVFQTQGFVDTYAPPAGIAALAESIGLPLLQPILHPDDTYALHNVPAVSAPVSANMAMGRATAAWQQFNAPRGHDGHFVVFDVAAAKARAASFLHSYAYSTDGSARIQ